MNGLGIWSRLSASLCRGLARSSSTDQGIAAFHDRAAGTSSMVQQLTDIRCGYSLYSMIDVATLQWLAHSHFAQMNPVKRVDRT